MKYGLNYYKPPCKLAFRGHMSEVSDPKVRPVWVAPAEIIAIERMYF